MADSKTNTDRQSAKAAGEKRYCGKPCPRGHGDVRFVSNRCCVACAAVRTLNQRECQRVYATDWRAKNPERVAIILRTHRAKNRIAMNEKARASYAQNPSKGRDRVAAYRIKNPEASRKYYLANTIKYYEKARRRRARKANADGHHTKADIDAIYAKQKGRCIACLCILGKKYDVDHKIALCNGGSDWPSNLQILCPPCNGSKHTKDPIAWAQEQGRLL